METEPGQQYIVKLRYKNDIFSTTLSGYMIDDLQYKGINSSVIPTLTSSEKTGVAVGNFKYPLEFISVEQIQQEDSTTEMEVVQVS